MRALLAAALVVAALAGCLTPAAETLESTGLPADVLPDYAPGRVFMQDVLGAVAAGEPLTIEGRAVADGFLLLGDALGAPREFEVELRPSPMIDAATWAEVDGVRVAMPDVHVFEGDVVGYSAGPVGDALKAGGNEVRLTVTPDWSRGSIRVGDIVYLVRVGLDGNLPYVEAADDARAARATAVTPPARIDGADWPEQDCLELVPPHVAPMTDVGQATDDALTARIVMDGDAQFVEALGPHAMPTLVAMLNEVDSIYDYEVGIRFQLVGLHLNTDEEYYPDPEEEAPLGKMEEYWNARADVERDIVHLVTGQESGYAQANCIGGAGIPEIGYTFTPLNWEHEYVVFHTNAFAHELGHIFSAHHHYGNHVESGGRGATIMIQGYTPGLRPVFGTVEKTTIRGWAEQYLESP